MDFKPLITLLALVNPLAIVPFSQVCLLPFQLLGAVPNFCLSLYSNESLASPHFQPSLTTLSTLFCNLVSANDSSSR